MPTTLMTLPSKILVLQHGMYLKTTHNLGGKKKSPGAGKGVP